MNRRGFIRNLSLAFPALALHATVVKALGSNQITGGSVVIIGAGASGLYAAKVLSEGGFDVTVLEASGIHGGRIRKVEGFASFPFEAGAEWVMGIGNTMGDPPSFLTGSINDYNPSLLTEYTGFKELYAIDDSFIVYPPEYDPDLTDVDIFLATLSEYEGADITVSDYLETLGVVEGDRTWHFYEAWIGTDYSTSIKNLGMKSLAVTDEAWLVGGKNFVLQQPYIDVLDDVFFNPVLPLVQYNKVDNAVDYAGSTVTVQCNDGSSYTADRVLVTVPLAVLKTDAISFTPALPAEKQAAIDIINMDNTIKFQIRFSERFWNEDICELTFKNYASFGWDPTYFKDFATDNMLTLFVSGERADYLSSLDAGAIDILLAELDTLFDGAATAAYIDHFVQDWGKEPYILGGYSSPGPGTCPTLEESKRKDLAAPIDCKVFFAGEATNDNHSGTVHGALESGARAALEIIDCPVVVNVSDSALNTSISIFIVDQTATIHLQLAEAATVVMQLHHLNGQLVSQLLDENIGSGEHSIQVDLPYLAVGCYLVSGTIGGRPFNKKVVIM